MSAPKYVPVPTTELPRSYESPDVVPEHWTGGRPGELVGPQPEGTRLGFQGPDQGYALKLADEQIRPRLQLADGEHAEDALTGCVGVAMRRASLYGRAPVIHDLTIAFTIWGYLDPSPPADLVALRKPVFEGVGHVAHHYAEARAIVDGVPETTLRMTHGAVKEAYPSQWRGLLGI